ncbi:MAG: DUF6036 family nucleotidyltransferase [Pyrinomonadaceae bacterium]
MRELATKNRIIEFMRLFGRKTRIEVRVYFTGGSTAVLLGWRETTLDIDSRFEPEPDELYRANPEIKEKLQLNIELAAPSDFIPELLGWQERCQFIGREGSVSFFHYDPYSQALSKIERGHEQDLRDVKLMLSCGLVDPAKLLGHFKEIVPKLYKYPAIDPSTFAKAVNRVAS